MTIQPTQKAVLLSCGLRTRLRPFPLRIIKTGSRNPSDSGGLFVLSTYGSRTQKALFSQVNAISGPSLRGGVTVRRILPKHIHKAVRVLQNAKTGPFSRPKASSGGVGSSVLTCPDMAGSRLWRSALEEHCRGALRVVRGAPNHTSAPGAETTRNGKRRMVA